LGALRCALRAESGDARPARPCRHPIKRMRLHAIVSDLDTANTAVERGATVLQLRLKGVSTDEVVAQGAPFRDLARSAGIAFVINDDLEAALQLDADGVHLGREDEGAQDALAAGVLVGRSASADVGALREVVDAALAAR